MSSTGATRNLAARVVDSPAFTTVVVATIAVNAVVLGLQTYTTGSSTAGVTPSTSSTPCVSGSSSSSS